MEESEEGLIVPAREFMMRESTETVVLMDTGVAVRKPRGTNLGLLHVCVTKVQLGFLGRLVSVRAAPLPGT